LSRGLKRGFFHVLSGNILYFGCQWGVVMALAKLGSPEQLGEYALGMAVSAPILLFANLQLRALIASDVNDQFTFGQYLTFRLCSLAVALVVLGVAACAGSPWRRAAVIIMVGFAQAVDYTAEVYYGWMQKHGRLDRMSRSLAIKGPLALGALCAVMYVTRSLLWAVLGLVAGRLAVLLLWDSRLSFAGGKSPLARLDGDWRDMLRLVRLSLPLGIISMLGGLNSGIPRYFVEAYRGSAELGIFSAIASLLSTGSLVVSAFGQSIFLPVAKTCARLDRTAFRGYVLVSMAVGAVLGGTGLVVATAFGHQILARLFRPEYAEREDVLVRMMIAATVSLAASGAGYVVTAARSLNPQIPTLVAAGAVAAGISAWSIPRHGLSGAADAVLAAALVQLVGTAVIVRRIDRGMRNNISTPVQSFAATESPDLEAQTG
jgi:O-antigen/teichoic acid export membrane protein